MRIPEGVGRAETGRITEALESTPTDVVDTH